VAGIDFEGDVAAAIGQHHERLDGSGYPAGLIGDQILPEARVLAVCDVVEAMISHRPYRAALPLEAAMTELENGAGRIYDAAACSACIKLFREDGLTISD
jgi:HD-GYP domain-containing protein (c-di-GMP phosphodiesterase class II)